MALDYRVTERAKQLRRVLHRPDALRIHFLPQHRPARHRDPEPSRLPRHFFQIGTLRWSDTVGRTNLGAMGGVEYRRAVAYRAGEHVLHHTALPDLPAIGTGRRPPSGGLESEQSTARRRDPDAATAIATAGNRDDPGRDRRRGTATRAARRPIGVPGILGRAKRLGFGKGSDAELGSVGLAEGDEPRLAIADEELGVVVGDEARQEPASGLHRFAGDERHQVLDQERHPAEWAVRHHGTRLDAGPVVHPVDDRVDDRIPLPHPMERLIHQLGGGDLA